MKHLHPKNIVPFRGHPGAHWFSEGSCGAQIVTKAFTSRSVEAVEEGSRED